MTKEQLLAEAVKLRHTELGSSETIILAALQAKSKPNKEELDYQACELLKTAYRQTEVRVNRKNFYRSDD